MTGGGDGPVRPFCGHDPGHAQPFPREMPAPRPRSRRRSPAASLFLLVPLLAGLLQGCAVNPATGERQLVLFSEFREIQIGREADPEIVASLGLLGDDGWQAYVQRLGETMALRSERPDLPWTFRVVDDPVVNAFALPGGFIYVTRGILTHFSSEAELAGVLGHEIGHVTARHSVSQMSRAQLAQVGLGVGTILRPDLAPVAEAAAAGFGLLFLSYGRDDEREADDLGLRYMTRAGYDPAAMAETFEMLADASGAREGAGRLPTFLSTHPDPLERRDRIARRIGAGEVSGERIAREDYLDRLDGMPFGADPRLGYFEGNTFLHPDGAFRAVFPAGWEAENGAAAVQAASPEGDAVVSLTVEDGASPDEALADLLADLGSAGSNRSRAPINGLVAARADFVAPTDEGTLAGAAAFVRHGDRLYGLLGYGSQAGWARHAGAIRATLLSFGPVSDPAVLNRQPDRIRIVRLADEMTLEGFHERYPSAVPIGTIATINHLEPGELIPAGTLMKQVVPGAAAR